MLSNWKTTLVGTGLGFLNLWANGMSAKQAGIALGLAILGAMSKDFNATGGSVPVTPEAKLRVK